ncbi:hypothetical protein [Rhodospirillum sp. A1_3_36]|uniref:hypothetical protein n=1 Tax=Rhodospirillum sp. A1_3_36 TaxID=3391666 RepID=UPI0039A649C1
MGLSLFWLIVFSLSVSNGSDWPGLGGLSPIGLAAVIAAAVLPMALIWAVTAVVAQTLRASLHGKPRRRHRGGDDSESLARTVIMMQEQARRRAFLDSADMGLQDLCAHLTQIMDRLDIIDRAELETQWALTSAGYPWAIPNTLLYCAEKSGPGFADLLAERLAEDGPSAAALQRFLRRHALLEELSRTHDEDRLLRAILEDGPMERVALMLEDVDIRMRALLEGVQPTATAHLSSAQDTSDPYSDDDFNAAMIDPQEALDSFEGVDGNGKGDNFGNEDPDRNNGDPDRSEDEKDQEDRIGDMDHAKDRDWITEEENAPLPPRQHSPPRATKTTTVSHGRLAERLKTVEAPPAGGRAAPEPKETAEDIARRLPYPPLSGSDMASIQERVARSLSRSTLTPSQNEHPNGKEWAAASASPPRLSNQFDMFGDPDSSREDWEVDIEPISGKAPPTSHDA